MAGAGRVVERDPWLARNRSTRLCHYQRGVGEHAETLPRDEQIDGNIRRSTDEMGLNRLNNGSRVGDGRIAGDVVHARDLDADNETPSGSRQSDARECPRCRELGLLTLKVVAEEDAETAASGICRR